ncbi:MAG: hypothetical protein K6E29_01125 [Cyanobacteria bacterium RUI128]|nr:hypothetical protein [Cyanobacteria bacterium RUI128]
MTTIIGQLLEKLAEVEQRLEISDKTGYNEDVEDDLKALGIDTDALELQLLVCDLTTPDSLKKRLTSEINTHMSDEQKKEKIVVKYIGDWKVIFINNGFDNYKFLDIEEIK